MKWITLFLAVIATSSVAEISRDHVLKTGPTERLVENPPADIAERSEAIIDAIWEKDNELFVSAAAGPESGRLGFVAKSKDGLEEIIREFRNFYRGDLRTMRHPPKWPTPDAKRPWVRVSVQRMNNAKVRGQFILIFSGDDWALERVTLNLYNHLDLPAPEPEIADDIIRDRLA
ncbi:MAG: hypothetical protein AAF585_23835, partial [Verrucomicrobiota bacterium]